jgi:hypothetical protein
MPHRKQNPGYYETFQPLTEEDVTAMKEYIIELFQDERYSNDQWCL